MSVEYFKNNHLLITARLGHASTTLAVCFDSYTDTRTLEREPFGAAFMEKHKTDAISIQSAENDWYQYSELKSALAKVADTAKSYSRVLAYGSSMGGYAAIRFGDWAGAHLALAISPQFSINPALCPWENRWSADSGRIAFPWRDGDLDGYVREAVVAYDPYDCDARHVALISEKTRAQLLPLPFSGHPATGFLSETGLLTPFVLGVLRGAYDLEEVARLARTRRRSSAQFLATMAIRMGARRVPLQIDLLREANRIAPTNSSHYLCHLGHLLEITGNFDEAEAIFSTAIGRNPDDPATLYNYSEHLSRTGRHLDALNVLSRLNKDVSATLYGKTFGSRLDQLNEIASQNKLTRIETARECLRVAASRLHACSKELLHRSKLSFVDQSEITNATHPAPPQNAVALRRHLALCAALNLTPYEIVLLGDSHAEFWPCELWSRQVLNCGVAGDKTQNTLWRLDRLLHKLVKPRAFVVVLGTNNLGMGDSVAGIVAGLEAVGQRLRRSFKASPIVFVSIPPIGARLGFRNDDRLSINHRMAINAMFDAVQLDELLLGPAASGSCWLDDKIHLSGRGYRLIHQAVECKLRSLIGVTPSSGRHCHD